MQAEGLGMKSRTTLVHNTGLVHNCCQFELIIYTVCLLIAQILWTCQSSILLVAMKNVALLSSLISFSELGLELLKT